MEKLCFGGREGKSGLQLKIGDWLKVHTNEHCDTIPAPKCSLHLPEHRAIIQQRLESERTKYGSFGLWNTKAHKKDKMGLGVWFHRRAHAYDA